MDQQALVLPSLLSVQLVVGLGLGLVLEDLVLLLYANMFTQKLFSNADTVSSLPMSIK